MRLLPALRALNLCYSPSNKIKIEINRYRMHIQLICLLFTSLKLFVFHSILDLERSWSLLSLWVFKVRSLFGGPFRTASFIVSTLSTTSFYVFQRPTFCGGTQGQDTFEQSNANPVRKSSMRHSD